MKQTNLILALLLVVSILYNGFQAYQRRSNTEMTPVMSYEEFSGFFEDLDENLTLKGYQNLENTGMSISCRLTKPIPLGKEVS